MISVIHGHQNPLFPFDTVTDTVLCRSPIAFAGRAVLTLPQHWENARGKLRSVSATLGLTTLIKIPVFPANWVVMSGQDKPSTCHNLSMLRTALLVSFVCIAYIGARTRDQEPTSVRCAANTKLHIIGAGECAELPLGHHVGREPFEAIALGTCKRRQRGAATSSLPVHRCCAHLCP